MQVATAFASNNDWGQFVMIDVQQTSVSTNTTRFKPVLDTCFEYDDNEDNFCPPVMKPSPTDRLLEPIHYKIAFALIQNIHWLFSQSVAHIGQKLLLFCNGKQK